MLSMLPPSFNGTSLMAIRLSNTTKVVLLSVTAGVALMGGLSRILRRRKGKYPRGNPATIPNDSISMHGSNGSAQSNSGSRSGSDSAVALSEHISSVSVYADAGANAIANSSNMSALEMGMIGIEGLRKVITLWEEALMAFNRPGGVPSVVNETEIAGFCRRIQNLVDMSYALEKQSEAVFLVMQPTTTTTTHTATNNSSDDHHHETDATNDDVNSTTTEIQKVQHALFLTRPMVAPS